MHCAERRRFPCWLGLYGWKFGFETGGQRLPLYSAVLVAHSALVQDGALVLHTALVQDTVLAQPTAL
jgi:hypothetical protein